MDRAGQYILQRDGCRAFVPHPLPPEPPIAIDLPMQHLLSQADQALGRLDGAIQTLPNPDLFVYMYVRKEAVLSSQIEGTQSSLRDVLTAEAKIFDPERPHDVAEVINYVRAMKLGLQRIQDRALSLQLVREIHAELLQGVRGADLTPGQIRTRQNWIGHADASLYDAIFVPPPPEALAQCLSAWEHFLHDDAQLPVLVRIGLMHAQFETIHPFLDGNGRVGRLLIALMLCVHGILLKPVLYLSYYLKKHRQEYYDQLQQVRDRGTWEEWLMFFVQGVVEVSAQASETARAILKLREVHRAMITQGFGRTAGNAYRVLDRLYGEHPIMSVVNVQALIGTSYAAANGLVKQFVDHGILQEVTGFQRNRQFIYLAYTNLFDDAAEMPSPP